MWGYSDSGHAGDKEILRGRTGYVFLNAQLEVVDDEVGNLHQLRKWVRGPERSS